MFDLSTTRERNIAKVERFYIEQAHIYEREAERFEQLGQVTQANCMKLMAVISYQRAKNVRAEEEKWIHTSQTRAEGLI